jgi:glutamate dehydrogenase
MDLLRNGEDPERMWLAMRFLVDRADLDRKVEFLPDLENLRKRELAAGGTRGLTRPELSVLLGYTKLFVKRELIASEIPSHPSLDGLFEAYFPSEMHSYCSHSIAQHRLRQEITATCLTNRVIDCAGATLVPELTGALGVGAADVVAAYYTADRILGGDRLRGEISVQGVDEAARLRTELAFGVSVRQLASRLLGLEGCALLDEDKLPRWSDAVRVLCGDLTSWASETEAARVESDAAALEEAGFARELGLELAHIAATVDVMGALPLSLRTQVPLLDTVVLQRKVGRVTRITWLLEHLRSAERVDGWGRVAADVLYIEMLDVQRCLTERMLDSAALADPFEAWCAEKAAYLQQIDATVAQVEASHDRGLASLTFLAQRIRRLR